MSLTYQPFAQVPEVQKLSNELHMNVSDPERLVSGVAGFLLAGSALSRSGLARWALLLAGGALIRRGFTGQCELYSAMNIDKRHGQAGVPDNRGQRIEATVEVRCPADTLYDFWRKLEQLPRILRNVKSVTQTGGKRSHWEVAGPAGTSVEWDAEIINEQKGRFIAWQSLPGASVSNAGSVWFEENGDGVTRVKAALEYDPPAGAVGAAIAGFFGASPQAELEEDLQRFKEFAESELSGSAAS